jgi:predicted kinase
MDQSEVISLWRRGRGQTPASVPGPVLVVVSGLPGVGKSVVAAAIAATLGGVHLSIDPVEDAMLGCKLPAGWNLGVAAYEAVRTMAEANLALGALVVVDAVNDSDAARQTWLRAAGASKASLAFAHLTCSDADEHRRRLQARVRGFAWLPEPSWEQVVDRSRNYVPWDFEHVEVDTANSSVDEVCGRVCTYVVKR